MKAKLLLFVFVMCAFVPSAFAQEPDGEDEKIVLPDEIMRQVVGRIIQWEFKPRRVRRSIPVANLRIKREWLPTIANVDFDLLSENDVLKYGKEVFIFESLKSDGEIYSLYVGWGDLDCSASGHIWKFRVVGDTVRLWPAISGWGRICGLSGDSTPIIHGLKVGDPSPNEIPGYEFFKEGKLKGIRLGVSTREEIKRIFGSTCEGPCDYDENWRIWVNYFDTGSCGTRTTYSSGATVKTYLDRKPERSATLRFIRMIPKKQILFSKVEFSNAFGRGEMYPIGDSFSSEGKFQGAEHSKIITYTDGYGLQYDVFDSVTFNNLPQSEMKKVARRKGDLIEIEYNIPDSLQKDVCNERVEK